ncbi:MAG: hypothetical protein VX000_06420, partial [Myxococcota bacterium]|nr:hypothetical protein [Myxococcota bacterium]
MSIRVVPFMMVVAGAVLVACTGGQDDAPPDRGDAAVDAPEGALDDGADASKRLVVKVQPVGPAGEAPRHLAVRLRQTVFDADAVGGEAPDGTKLAIEPELPGIFRVAAPDALVFEPESGFRPGTEYTAQVLGVATEEGVAEAPEGGWSTRFETPEFGLVRAGVWKRDTQRATLDVDLAFSAAVDASVVGRNVRFELEGEPVRPARVSEGPRDSVGRVRFEGRRFAQDGTLAVSLGTGVSWTGDAGI